MTSEIRVEWDARKADSNKRKHGVSFESAALVFGDPRVYEYEEETTMEKSGTEPSGKSVGGSFSLRTLRSKKVGKKSSASSRRAKPTRKNVVRIKGIPKMTAEMRRELEALDKRPDDQIDFSDIPEMTDEDWNRPHYIGLHYYPGKKSVTIRLDDDLVKWFKAHGKGWQTKMNWVLRLYFASHRKTGVKLGRP